MALTKIRQANRRWRHELKRKRKADLARRRALIAEAERKKLRKAALQERRDQLERRDVELSYVDSLAKEVQGG